jgi:hypothetical protein
VVAVVGPPALREMVELAGHPFLAGGEPPEAAIAPIRERLPVAAPLEASVLGNRELFGRLATTAMLPAMERVFAEWRPDLVLRDPCEYASAVVAGGAGIATAQVAISLADLEAGSITTAGPALDAHRRGLTEELRASPYLSRFPASLDPSPFATTIRFRDDATVSPAPLPDWWNGWDAPLVYLSFGTVLGHMSIAGDVYATALEAVGAVDARVLLTVGRRFDPSELAAVPPNVHVERWVDQASVLTAADVVVCHGGSGTAFGALAAGVPLVVVPLFADQFENGRRIAASGAGLTIESAAPSSNDGSRNLITRDDARRIATAIETVMITPGHRARAREIAAEMAAAHPVNAVLDELLRPARETGV